VRFRQIPSCVRLGCCCVLWSLPPFRLCPQRGVVPRDVHSCPSAPCHAALPAFSAFVVTQTPRRRCAAGCWPKSSTGSGSTRQCCGSSSSTSGSSGEFVCGMILPRRPLGAPARSRGGFFFTPPQPPFTALQGYFLICLSSMRAVCTATATQMFSTCSERSCSGYAPLFLGASLPLLSMLRRAVIRALFCCPAVLPPSSSSSAVRLAPSKPRPSAVLAWVITFASLQDLLSCLPSFRQIFVFEITARIVAHGPKQFWFYNMYNKK
jgi:hypothetical protein